MIVATYSLDHALHTHNLDHLPMNIKIRGHASNDTLPDYCSDTVNQVYNNSASRIELKNASYKSYKNSSNITQQQNVHNLQNNSHVVRFADFHYTREPSYIVNDKQF